MILGLGRAFGVIGTGSVLSGMHFVMYADRTVFIPGHGSGYSS